MNVRIVCLNHPVNSLNPTPCGVQIMFSARKLLKKIIKISFLKGKTKTTKTKTKTKKKKRKKWFRAPPILNHSWTQKDQFCF